MTYFTVKICIDLLALFMIKIDERRTNLEQFYHNVLQACVETNILVKSEKKKFKTIYARRRHAIFRKMKRKKYNNKIQQLQEQLRKTYDEEKQDEECRAVKCIKTNPK